jgi:hypothetical protein
MFFGCQHVLKFSFKLLQTLLTRQKPTFVVIRAKYCLLCEVSASGPVSRITTYDLPFPPTERIKPSYLCKNDRIGMAWVHCDASRVFIIEEAVKQIPGAPPYLSRVDPRGRESLFDISTYPPLVKTNPETNWCSIRKLRHKSKTNTPR